MTQLLQRKIPTLLGLFVLFFGVGASTLLVQNSSIIESNASGSETPKDVRITNITDTSFTVSYITDSRVFGSISYGKTNSLGTVIPDDRDSTISKEALHTSHYFTIKNLEPSTDYYFSVLSGDSVFLQNDTAFKVKTAPMLTGAPPKGYDFTGFITFSDISTKPEVILYLQSNTSQALSTLLRPDASYAISLSRTRSQDLTKYELHEPQKPLMLSFISTSGNSKVTIREGLKSTLPTIVLTENYDFSQTSNLTNTQMVSSPGATFSVSSEQKVKKAAKNPFTNSAVTPTLKPTLP